MTRLDSIAHHTTRWLLERPLQVAGTLAFIFASSVVSATTLKVESGISAFVPDSDPAVQFLREVERTFVSDDVLYVAYETDDLFSHRSLSELRGLVEALAKVEMVGTGKAIVDEVVSLATVKDVSGADMTFQSVPLVPEEIPTEAAALEAMRARALANPLIRDGLLSKKSPTVGALAVRLVPNLSDDEKAHTLGEVRRLTALRAAAGPTRYYVTGGAAGDADSAHFMQVDLQTFVPVCYGLLLILMYVFTRRIAGVMLAIINATVAMVAGMGVLALTGTLTNLSTIMPPLLMVLSVATVVHFLSEFARHTHQSGSDKAAGLALRELFIPAFMCELTTAVGFSSFLFSRIPALRDFGVAASLAVMLTFFTSFLVLALAVRRFGAERLISARGIATSARVEGLLGRYTDLAIRRPRTMLAVMGVITVAAGAGLLQLRIDHDTMAQFSERLPIRQATDFVDAHLGGSGDFVVSVRTNDESRFLEPKELAKLEALQRFLLTDLGGTSSESLTDFVKLMHRGFNADAPEAFRIPDNHQQVAQLMLLNGDDRVYQFADRSFRWARVTARTTERSTAALTARFEQLERYLEQHFPASEGYQAAATGGSRLSVVMAGQILSSQTSSFLLSLVLIFIPIMLVFGSVVAGLWTIPSNLFPVLACLGLMGWLDIPLDVANTMITSIVLGIAVDDTIHFIQSMRTELIAHGDLERALRHTMATKGVGAVWITLIITLGFLSLVISNFGPTSNFGLLTAFAMVAGILAEVFMLPPLLLLTRSTLGVRPGQHLEAPAPAAVGSPALEEAS